MKKLLAVALCLITALLTLTSCSKKSEDTSKLKIFTTTFPQYDWTKNILGSNIENVELCMLEKGGVDMHSFQPSAADIINISGCDIFIYVGGASDKWVDDILKTANGNMKPINLMQTLGDSVKEEELAEGMQEDGDDGDEAEYDEHVWLSLRCAKILCKKIAEVLISADPENKDLYTKNLNIYIKKLDELDGEYKAAADVATKKTLIFGDRFPFRYLFDDYALKYYAAFAGCSAETEASFQTVSFLSKKVDELGTDYVFTIDNSNTKIAETIIKNTKSKTAKILKLNSLQSVTDDDIKNGAGYITAMKENLEILKEAFK